MRPSSHFFLAACGLSYLAYGQGNVPPPGSVTLSTASSPGLSRYISSGDVASLLPDGQMIGAADICNDDDYSIAISQDNRQLNWIFDTDNMMASLDPSTPRSSDSKKCIVQARLEVPAGYTFKVENCRFWGYCYLEPMVTGKISTSYGFQDRLDESTLSKSMYGPMAEDFSLNLFEDTPKWSPCAEPDQLTFFNVVLDIGLISKDTTFQSRGLIQGGAIDTNFTQILALDWETCQLPPQ
ncbi:hypothetical protein P152DRAFT_483993 [Eremomyces bilateralis CBS 781.70]|uniref:Secreted protein n=1 Tax=Eremomyces bilateralis CBS 781.70 TaxID=1392243 RepID=A0A6G1FWG3_9PEZI|nr:uncharacterized protein P152DRAFT_483993 [Eremomyces bilateralis CBS 781.70]KAF1810177.1 hypothetical protein P152DRAFT_483993 [Eremomyces bilateralis CBS 781.70]